MGIWHHADLIDGLQLTPTSFGEVTDDGFWQINDASELTFGTNGFLLEGGANVAAGLDTSNGDYASTDTEVSLLMHMEGSDTSTTFLDSSRKGHILTANANAQIDTAVSKFGTSAALFDGNTDNISIPKNSALSFGTGDFIVEAWMNFDSVDTSSVWKTMCNVGTYFSLGNNSGNVVLYMASVFSDPLSLSTDTWYHICFSRVSGTVYFFVNGVAKGSASYSGSLGSTETHFIGAQNGANANPMDGHIDELRIIKGRGISSAFTPETSAYSNPLAANDFGITGTITATNDSPTNDADNGYGNHLTLDPLDVLDHEEITYSNGNKTMAFSNASDAHIGSTIALPNTGKFYIEFEPDVLGGSGSGSGIFIYTDNVSTAGTNRVARCIGDSLNADWQTDAGVMSHGSYAVGQRCAIEIDIDADTFKATIDGSTTATTSSVGYNTGSGERNFIRWWHSGGASRSDTTTIYPSSDGWQETPGAGFVAIATQNLPTPAIINPDDHFFSNIVTHNGTSTASTCTFNLDTYEWLAIIKNTTGAVEKWYWIDSLNGVTKYWSSNASTALTTDANVLTVSGTTFTLGSTLGAKDYLVEFHKAGLAADTAEDTTGSINSINSSVNTTSGFFISRYTGTGAAGTVGNGGASAATDFMIVKRMDSSSDPTVFHSSNTAAPETDYLILSTSAATADNILLWNDTLPSSTVFSLSTGSNINTNTGTYCAWGWHSVEGYSSFGSYTGNSNADGPMINVGGSPASIMIKRTSAGENWLLLNDLEPGYNLVDNVLYPNLTHAMAVNHGTTRIDILSNGAKVRGTNTNINSGTYIYGAFGIQPLTDSAINQVRADGRGSAPLAIATGGTITLDGDYAINTFNASGTLIFDTAPEDGVEYLVIAGGGGGGANYRAGGGGGGGYRTATGLAVEAISLRNYCRGWRRWWK